MKAPPLPEYKPRRYRHRSSKTFWGGALLALGVLVDNSTTIANVVPHAWGPYIVAAGTILATMGIRGAIAKNGVDK